MNTKKNLLARIIATGFYSGYSPIAPGTAGTLVAVILYWLAIYLLAKINLSFDIIPSFPINLPTILYLILAIIGVFFIGVWSANIIEKEEGKEDPGLVVIDEISGYFITMLWLPTSYIWLLAGFFAFRFFDILKPPPVRQMEKYQNGWGIMLDDVLAGVYANLLLQIIRFIWFR